MWLATPNSPPTYDTQWQLVWGEQLARGEIPSYGTGPTVHPLMVVLGALLSLLSFHHDDVVDQAVRALTMVGFASIGLLCARMAYFVAGSLPALLVAILVLSRPFVFLFARVSYFDVIFVALGLAAFVSAYAGRNSRALWLLACAGLLRPEGWLYAAVLGFALWWRQRRRLALLSVVALAPVVWCCWDWVVTGDPLYSFLNTRHGAATLGRDRGLGDALLLGPVRAAELVGPAVAVLLVLGGVLAWRRRRISGSAQWLLTLVVIATGSYLATNGLGTSVLSRYLLFPVMAAMPLIAYVVVEIGDLVRRSDRLRRVGQGLTVAFLAVCAWTTVAGIRQIRAGLTAAPGEIHAYAAVHAAADKLRGCKVIRTNDYYVVSAVARELDMSPASIRLTTPSAVRPSRTELIGDGNLPATSTRGIDVRHPCVN
jgi:hypothetical protein